MSRQETVRFREAAPSTRLLPVNSSHPAAMTRLRAAAKTRETRNFTAVEPAAVANPPMHMAAKLPKAMNIPASMADRK